MSTPNRNEPAKTGKKAVDDKSRKQNEITQKSKKGLTLGAQHASHGDSGAEKSNKTSRK